MNDAVKRTITNRGPYICVCVPCGDRVHTEFLMSMWSLGRYFTGRQGFVTHRSSIIVNSRNSLVRIVQLGHKECTHILFLDSDMVFPQDLANRLLTHDLPIVGCDYRRRGHPFNRLAVPLHGKDIGKTEGLVEVEKIGTGAIMIQMKVFEKMAKPYFYFEADPSGEYHHGEDYVFCRDVRKLGYRIFCDYDVSKEVQHMYQMPLYLADPVLDNIADEAMKKAVNE